MYTFGSDNGAGQTAPPLRQETAATDQPPSYESTVQAINAEQAQFHSRMVALQEQTVRLITTQSEEHQCRPELFARQLANFLIERFGLTDTRLSPAASVTSSADSTLQNPTDPDLWDWDAWQAELYSLPYYNRNDEEIYLVEKEEILGDVEIKLDVYLRKPELLNHFKLLPSVKKSVGAWNLSVMNSFLQMKNVIRDKCLPLTPIIKDCISSGLFPRAFIDKLHKMAIPGSAS
ncbi:MULTISPECIES: hypothetical protein [unclassified Endozoicomonas]|uniref:hypothetical protein n=1 Tax=unclassified Endozoicomonas TaxID=2644528 RepID=UPI003BB5518C